jgi:hypothetical protein
VLCATAHAAAYADKLHEPFENIMRLATGDWTARPASRAASPARSRVKARD